MRERLLLSAAQAGESWSMTRVCMDLVLFHTEFSTHGVKVPPTQLLRAAPKDFVCSGAQGTRATGAPKVMDSREPQVVSWCLRPRQEGLLLAPPRRFVSVEISLDARGGPPMRLNMTARAYLSLPQISVHHRLHEMASVWGQ